MNNDLISREALKTDIDFQYICKCCHNVNGNVCDICHISEIEKKIDNAPTVETEIPKGEWIDAYPEIEKNPMFNYGICSRCKFEQSMSNKLNFCPNCGADMRKGGAE